MIPLVVFLTFLFIFLKFRNRDSNTQRTGNPEPPAVWYALPLVGNLLSLGKNPHLKLAEWAGVYGSIFTIKVGSQKVVVVDDPKQIREIFSKPAFSGRGDHVPLEYFSSGRNGIMMSEGKSLEAYRRFTLKHLREFGFGKNYMESLIAGEVNRVLDTLKQNAGKPFPVQGAFNVAVINALWTVTSGESLSQTEMNYLNASFRYFNKLITTGAMFSPWIRRFVPGLSGWTDFRSSVDKLTDFFEQTVQNHKQTRLESSPRDLTDAFISEVESCQDPNSPFYGKLGYKNLRAIIGDMFVGGSETIPTSLEWTLLYLTVHADVQEKLQIEIDSVVGKQRKPCLADRIKMPYAEAVISEVLRKSSVAPLGAFQRALFDTEFHGFMIRKGTAICGNLYSSHHNPKYWDQPEAFRPERFLMPTGLELIKKPDALNPFQAGRRQCIGEQFAKDTLFLFITAVFQAFRTLPDKGSTDLDMEPIPGFSLHPKAYSILINTRD